VYRDAEVEDRQLCVERDAEVEDRPSVTGVDTVWCCCSVDSSRGSKSA